MSKKLNLLTKDRSTVTISANFGERFGKPFRSRLTSFVSRDSEEEIRALKNLTQLLNRGHIDKSSTEAKQLLKRFPNSAKLHNVFGAISQKKGEFILASKHYEQALNNDANYSTAHHNLAVCLSALGLTEKALKHHEEAVILNPNFAQAYYQWGITYTRRREIEKAIQRYKVAIDLEPNNANALVNLGNSLSECGKLQDAINCFQKSVEINPGLWSAYNNWAGVLVKLGEFKHAIKRYKEVVKLKPDHSAATYMLAALRGEQVTTAPTDYIKNIFDKYADSFDMELVQTLKYEAPTILFSLFDRTFLNNLKVDSGIDLGCGTGLSGKPFKKSVTNFIGVDLSESMILAAKKKKIYDQLFISEIESFLERDTSKYDIFISTDVFIYVGNLVNIFRLIGERSQKSAKLLFCTESLKNGTYKLNNSGRFSHSKKYVVSILEENGFRLVSHEQGNLRKEKNEFVLGDFYISERVS